MNTNHAPADDAPIAGSDSATDAPNAMVAKNTCSKCGIAHTIPDDYTDGDPAGFSCAYCGGRDVRIVMRLQPTDWHATPYSIAGMQTKCQLQSHPYAVCGGCGHQSKGKP